MFIMVYIDLLFIISNTDITGSKEGRELLFGSLDILKQLVTLMQDDSIAIAKDAALSAINISADEAGANAFLTISESAQQDKEQRYSLNLIKVCIRYRYW